MLRTQTSKSKLDWDNRKEPPAEGAPPLAFKRIAPVKGRTKIERYNMEDYAWKLFFNFSKEPKDIADLCNIELHNRRSHLEKVGRLPSGWKHERITTTDVNNFIHRMQMHIDYMEGRRLEKIYRSTLDTVRQLQLVLTEIKDWYQAWQDIVKSYLAQGKIDAAAELYKLMQKDRTHVMQASKILSDIKGKVKTHIHVDVLKMHLRNLIGVVESSENLPDDQKDILLSEIGEVIESARTNYEEEEY